MEKGDEMSVGLDTNILCYALDSAYSENYFCRKILIKLSPNFRAAINPTVLHESYHTLVFSQKWVPDEARRRLTLLLTHPYIDFYNQTKRICTVALDVASKYNLGGRDSLITANFLLNKVSILYTRDAELLELKEIKWRNFTLKFVDPTRKMK